MRRRAGRRRRGRGAALSQDNRKHPPQARRSEAEPAKAPALPAWLTRAAPAVEAAERSVTPSSAAEDEAASRARPGRQRRAAARLAGAPAAAVAARYSAGATQGGDGRLSGRAWAQNCPPSDATRSPSKSCACSRMRASTTLYGPAAAPKCRSSAGWRPAASPIRVSGQVDRLAVTQASVLIADFKTNRAPPRSLEEVPPDYVRQLALYRAVLTQALSRTGPCAPPSSGPKYLI